MISGFVFNQDIVIHMLLVAAVVCAFVIAAVLTIFLVKLVERNCPVLTTEVPRWRP